MMAPSQLTGSTKRSATIPTRQKVFRTLIINFDKSTARQSRELALPLTCQSQLLFSLESNLCFANLLDVYGESAADRRRGEINPRQITGLRYELRRSPLSKRKRVKGAERQATRLMPALSGQPSAVDGTQIGCHCSGTCPRIWLRDLSTIVLQKAIRDNIRKAPMVAEGRSRFSKFSPVWLYFDRVIGGNRNHCHPCEPVITRA